jgi:molecular chaperone IbpA
VLKENGSGYLHHGSARRSFERRFSLADHMKVMGASLDNGLLHVDVVRDVPEVAVSSLHSYLPYP